MKQELKAGDKIRIINKFSSRFGKTGVIVKVKSYKQNTARYATIEIDNGQDWCVDIKWLKLRRLRNG